MLRRVTLIMNMQCKPSFLGGFFKACLVSAGNDPRVVPGSLKPEVPNPIVSHETFSKNCQYIFDYSPVYDIIPARNAYWHPLNTKGEKSVGKTVAIVNQKGGVGKTTTAERWKSTVKDPLTHKTHIESVQKRYPRRIMN